LNQDSFPQLSEMFRQLDANGDGTLEQDELAQLATIEPHIELMVAFGARRGTQPAATIAELRRQTVVERIAAPSPDHAVISLGNTWLVISAHDLASAPAPSANKRAERDQIRLMVHDQIDALFLALDRNQDRRLGEREIDAGSRRLLEWDASGDKQLAAAELPYCMVVAFLRGERPAEDSFYLPPSAPPTNSSKSAPAWFTSADLNGDGDVSPREFLGSREQFSRLDADGDGYVAAAEAVSPQAEQNDASTNDASNPF
jgi:hypothetical protein